MTFGYLRVSSVDQDNNKFQGEILLYSNKNHLGHVSFIEEKVTGVKDWKQRELGTLINTRCKSGDNIIVSELSRISRSITQIYEIITVCQEKEVTLHFIKQNLVIRKDNDMTTKVMLSSFEELSQHFLEELKKKKHCQENINISESVIRCQLSSWFSKYSLSEISSETVRQFQDDFLSKNYKYRYTYLFFSW